MAEVTPPTVTVTSTMSIVPDPLTGLDAVQLVDELHTTAVLGVVPKSTVVPVVENPVPVMVTAVPPVCGPDVGLIEVTVGAAVDVLLL
jgi:hypothetical protein